ncbi:transglycosylase domain-containing protein [uncultured Amnibacterium sp.]|uniref:transglycosylase domain-containing protein n=1 Tax=uncultured Amnibacterium sp. TaxID=1631851 RepID=UPI0035CBB156
MSAPDGRRHGAGSALLGLLAIAVTAGVMVTVGVAPAIALTGVSAKNGIGLFEDLPGELKLSAPSQKSELYGTSKGKPKLITSFYTQDRDVVGWDDVGPVVRNAALGAEDPRFYQHGGVDPQSIVRAALGNVLGKNLSGASTITQQYVKNVCLQEAERITNAKKAAESATECDGVTLSRKVREMRYAIGLEKKYSKDQILLGYLNIALFGGQVYGVEAAAEHYFGKHANELTVAQAASLMAMVQSPNDLRIDIKANIPANTARRDYVLGRELANNLITQEQYAEAMKTKVEPDITYPKSGCQAAGSAAYFCGYVAALVQENTALGKSFGATSDDRAAALYGGGLKIYTSLDLDLQKKAAATMKQYVPFKPAAGNIASAATTVEVGTGRVLTMTESKKFSGAKSQGVSEVNYNTDTRYGGSSGFQVGSTWKLFDLLEWMKQGHGINEVVNGNPRYIGPFNTCNGGVVEGSTWRNDSAGEGGFRTVYSATQNSVNAAFMTMVQKLNLCDIVGQATALGVHNASGKPLSDLATDMIGSGGNAIAPLTMATAYAGIADQGTFCTAMAIDKVVKPDGGTLPIPGSDCKQTIDKSLAIAAGYTLHGVLNGTATTDANGTGPAFQFAKTGTTDSARQTWLVGGSSKTVTAVWVGNVNGGPAGIGLRKVYGWPTCSYQNYSGQAALARHCLWHDMRQAAEDKYPGATSWPDPASQYLTGQLASVPNVAGMTVDAATSVLTAAGFQVKVGAQVDSDVPQGSVASTDPQAGSQTPAGTKITLSPSSGTPAQGTPLPDVFGQPLQNARDALQQAGFTNLQVNFVQGNGSCQVQGTNPAAGTPMPPEMPITVQVAGSAAPVNGSFACQ